MTHDNKLQVEAIKRGTVIDHIPAQIGFKLLSLFKLTETDQRITIGLNLPSGEMGRKDLIKIENTFLSEDQVDQLALYAPQATVNRIDNYEVVGKSRPSLPERIKEAILRAAKAAEVDDADYCATVAAVVSEQMQGRNQVDINEIQTAVENQLMSGPYKQLARAYIEYRHDRDIEREKRGRLNQEIRGLVEQTNASLLNENANKDSKVCLLYTSRCV